MVFFVTLLRRFTVTDWVVIPLKTKQKNHLKPLKKKPQAQPTKKKHWKKQFSLTLCSGVCSSTWVISLVFCLKYFPTNSLLFLVVPLVFISVPGETFILHSETSPCCCWVPVICRVQTSFTGMQCWFVLEYRNYKILSPFDNVGDLWWHTVCQESMENDKGNSMIASNVKTMLCLL